MEQCYEVQSDYNDFVTSTTWPYQLFNKPYPALDSYYWRQGPVGLDGEGLDRCGANGPSYSRTPCGLDAAATNFYAKMRFLQNPIDITYTKAPPTLSSSEELCLYCEYVGASGRMRPEHARAPPPRTVSTAVAWATEKPEQTLSAPRNWGLYPLTYSPPTDFNKAQDMITSEYVVVAGGVATAEECRDECVQLNRLYSLFQPRAYSYDAYS